jgi:glycosyltransferase involved in cell wall biosynthesis
LRAFHQIKYLSDFFDVHLFSITETTISQEDFNEVNKYCTEIEVVRQDKATIFFQLLKNTFSSLPFQVAYFNSKKIRDSFQNYTTGKNIDIVFFQLVRTAELSGLLSTKIPKVLDLMDAMSLNMQLRSRREYFPINMIFRNEAKRLRDYESKVAPNFKKLIAISLRDLNSMKLNAKENAVVIPNGIDTAFYHNLDSNSQSIDLLFVGSMSYVPNEEAVLYIHKEILPGLRQLNFFPQVAIVGHSPGKKLRKLHSDNFRITGRVTDTRDYYSRAKIFVAPMFYGTGQQNKILESMAMGVPVITTSHANEAIGALPGEEILIADSAEQFTKAIIELLPDENRRQSIARNARVFVEINYDEKISGNKLFRCLNEIN